MEESRQFNDNHTESLLNSILRRLDAEEILQLRNRFENKLNELGITSFQAEKQLGTDYKTLNRLLDGDVKKFDLITLIKIGYLLNIPEKDVSESFISLMLEQHAEEISNVKKMMFIHNNFDLDTLKKLRIIKKTNDYSHIENQLVSILGLHSILDYNPEDIGAAHSESSIKPKHQKNRIYFKSKSKSIFKLIDNPNPFDRQGVIDYFPKIRWHSTDVDGGMITVIKSLFKLGVTVIFQPKIPSLQMRGATFEVNGKPCIVLTDYMNSYPTMWFALVHELFHVLFDWEEILSKKYHLSDEETDIDVLKHKEDEANDFAREYFLPSKILNSISERIRQTFFIKEFASDNHVHPSIVYANFAFRNSDEENNYWAIYNNLIHPNMEKLIETMSVGLSYESSAREYSSNYLNKIYN